MSQQRLQKLIAQAGIASRRKAEILIAEGRVRLNGRIVTEPGTKADPHKDKIEVDGKRLIRPKAWTYVMLNKPDGVVTTMSDEFDRKNVVELIQGVKARIYPVGRLDLDAEGVLLLTNDGDLAASLTHPAGEIEKVYRVKVRGLVTAEAMERLQTGVILEDGFAQAKNVREVRGRGPASETNSWIELTVTEGRNHLVKRMCDAVGHRVVRLRRMSFAGLKCGELQRGKWRHLNRDELKKIKALGRAAKAKRAKSRRENSAL
ncbi:MAG: pseudouridine synthase [Myxococcota bacterium]|nr:pseudouridine synthase [Myxococcota bacterium]